MDLNLGGLQMPNFGEVQDFIKKLDFPINKQSIIDLARQRNMNDLVMGALERLPDGDYFNPDDIMNKVKGMLGTGQ